LELQIAPSGISQGFTVLLLYNIFQIFIYIYIYICVVLIISIYKLAFEHNLEENISKEKKKKTKHFHAKHISFC
jgi:hypothetical protein